MLENFLIPVLKKSSMRRALSLVLCLLILSGCKKAGPPPDFERISPQKALSVVQNMDIAAQGLTSWNDLLEPLSHSLDYASKRPRHELAIQGASLQLTWGKVQKSLTLLLELLPFLDRHPELLAERFTWYRQTKACLFTGYYEPTLMASPFPGPQYPWPMYGLPDDLLTVDLGLFHPRWQGQQLVYRLEDGKIKPYWDRQAIDRQNRLSGKNLELAWAADEIDVFFLQIQGSGRLVYPDGSSRHIVYAGKNGHEYVSLGKIMLERGLLKPGQVSMPAIRRVLDKHPELRSELLDANPSYVFFRLLDDGPFGSMGKKLTPWVSLACDKKRLPLGGLVVFSVKLPEKGSPLLQGIGLPQDIGGAIKGAHLDLFCGAGQKAENIAGHLQNMGQVWLLVSNGE